MAKDAFDAALAGFRRWARTTRHELSGARGDRERRAGRRRHRRRLRVAEVSQVIMKASTEARTAAYKAASRQAAQRR